MTQNKQDTVGTYMRNKISPVMSAMQMIKQGQDVKGKLLDTCIDNLNELAGIADLMETEGIVYDSNTKQRIARSRNDRELNSIRKGK